ncbi:anhydro-N-acetylmuramic acid kinase [Plantibacter flavus]|uniref:anhydro-N-acetylmuramic acid kinase n=1 Tax=Plantibacter flavus TaxID=150123 RepID=UPI003F16F7D7
MRVLGLLSGTSHDGIDAAVVDFTLVGDRLTGVLQHADTTPYPATLRARLVAALPPAATTFSEMCELDTLIGQSFADSAEAAVHAVEGPIDLIVTHGQTVFHWVDGAHALGTLQIGQPAWIAERTGVPVLSDVRIRDITAGGHGAPLIAFMDELLLAGLPGTPAALNLGGIANITVVPEDAPLTAYDLGPANALIDAVITETGANDLGYDEDGRLAAAGTIDDALLAVLLADPYFALPSPKSTGKEHFNGDYVRRSVARAGTAPSVVDLVATLTEFTVRVIADEVRRAGITRLVLSGGGCRNPVLVSGIRAACPDVDVDLSDALGAPADDKEAILFALIGWCSVNGLPATTVAGTGARARRILGSFTPGDGPLQLPAPLLAVPRSLLIEDARR